MDAPTKNASARDSIDVIRIKNFVHEGHEDHEERQENFVSFVFFVEEKVISDNVYSVERRTRAHPSAGMA